MGGISNAMRAALKRDRGMALLIVLGLVILLSLMSAVVLGLAGSHYRLSRHQIESVQAFYLAEAGVTHALSKMRDDTFYTGETLTLTDTDGNVLGTAEITINLETGVLYRVRSMVTY